MGLWRESERCMVAPQVFFENEAVKE